MRMEAHVSVAPTRLHGRELRRHSAERFDAGRAFFVTTARSWPRLFGLLRSSAEAGFEAGLKNTNLRGRERLHAAMRSARRALSEAAGSLIEREPRDVSVLGALLDGAELHVHRAGGHRAYVHRHGKTERITPRDEPSDGLLGETLWEGSLLLDPGDLVLLGTSTAFSTRAVGKVASVLAQDPDVPPAVVATILTEPADRAGAGAAAIALRAR